MLRQRGPLALIVAVFRRFVVDHREFYLFERYHDSWSDESFKPRLDQFEELFVADHELADRLAQSHEDFRSRSHGARNALEAGAIAFCVYVGRDVAHVAWLATTQRARKTLDGLGFEVPFHSGVAWTGAAWTAPSYRGRGLLNYGSYRRFEYLLRQGFTASRGAVEKHNYASQRTNMHFAPRVYAVGIYWRVLGRRLWSERALRPGEQAAMR